MNTNKILFLTTMSLLSGAFCALSAMAESARPEAYQNLTAVEIQPGHAPGLRGGFHYLHSSEQRYGERLPLQLAGAIKNVKAAKYEPHKKNKFKKRKTKSHRF